MNEIQVFGGGITLSTEEEREQRKHDAWQEKQFADLLGALRKMVDAEIVAEEQPFFVPIRRIKGCLDMVMKVAGTTGLPPVKVLENAMWAMDMLSNGDRRQRPAYTHADLEPHSCIGCGRRHARCCEDGEFCQQVIDAI